MSVLRRFLGALVLGLVVLTAAGFATGRLSSVVTTGVSMQPDYDAGDLVVVMRSDRYAVGDVAAYRDTDRGEVVLHRIVGGGPDGFRFQGDNNESVDVVTPPADELLGRQVLHVPRVGRWLGSPLMLALAAAVAIALAAWAALAPARRPDERAGSTAIDPTDGPASAAASRPRRWQVWRGWHVVLLLGDVAAVAALVVAFAVPPTVVPPPPVPMHVGSLSYRAEVPASDAYPDGVVETGDSVFARVTDVVEVAFRYEGDPATPATARLRMVIDASGGWTAAYELAPSTAVVAGGAELSASLDLAALRATLGDVEAQTGITLTTVQLRVEALVEPGSPEDPAVPAASPYALAMFFRFDDLGLDLAESSVVTASLDGPVVTSTEPVRDPVDEPTEVGGVPREARRWLIVALLVLVAATATSWPSSARRPVEAEEAEEADAPPVRRVAFVELPPVATRVQLASRAELDVVARDAGAPVLEREDGWAAVVTPDALHWWEPPGIPVGTPRWIATSEPAEPAHASAPPLVDVWTITAPSSPEGPTILGRPTIAQQPSAVTGPSIRETPTLQIPVLDEFAPDEPGADHDVVGRLRDELMVPRRPLFRARPLPAPTGGPRHVTPIVASRTTTAEPAEQVRSTIDEIVAYLSEVADRGGRAG